MLSVLLFSLLALAGDIEGFAVGSVSAITTYPATCAPLNRDTTLDPGSWDQPKAGYLDRLEGTVSNVTGGAGRVDWYLSKTADGSKYLTGEVQELIVNPGASATPVAVTLIESLYALDSDGTAGTIWACVKLDVGTADVVIRLIGSK